MLYRSLHFLFCIKGSEVSAVGVHRLAPTLYRQDPAGNQKEETCTNGQVHLRSERKHTYYGPYQGQSPFLPPQESYIYIYIYIQFIKFHHRQGIVSKLCNGLNPSVQLLKYLRVDACARRCMVGSVRGSKGCRARRNDRLVMWPLTKTSLEVPYVGASHVGVVCCRCDPLTNPKNPPVFTCR